MKIATMVLALVLVGCSTAQVRTKYTDPSHRVFIDPSGLDEDAYVRLQTSLVESNRFFIVDRARAFKAVKAEQDMIHRHAVGRFADEEKYAFWGKLYSVGAVVTARELCHWEQNFFSYALVCAQHMSAVDASTGLVIAAASHVARSGSDAAPTWDETVERFNRSFPTTFEAKKFDSGLEHYRKLAAENALRAKESKANDEE